LGCAGQLLENRLILIAVTIYKLSFVANTITIKKVTSGIVKQMIESTLEDVFGNSRGIPLNYTSRKVLMIFLKRAEEKAPYRYFRKF